MKKTILISFIFTIIMASLIEKVWATGLGTIELVAINGADSTMVENLKISVYQVSQQDEQGNLKFAVGFENCTLDVEDLSEKNLENLNDYAKANANPMFSKVTDSNGKFTLNNLEFGKYLFVQENKTDKITMQTMLISVPELIDGKELTYEVTAKPKIVNKEMIDRNETQITRVARDEQLPYTGVLNWPIPVLVIVGIIIFCIAWLKVYSKSKKKVE